ncbi:MAG TPA: hypothetical protein VE954_12565 [Oligoflexus sp.]|uniref:hypothetical protein n=1 Tax=Oligoflexus sp. TaxID=1971216 RepID=UPI002D3F1951|nr:hypothetical protein [Oligoflexus sp.]HYX33941.1 hypothetical protein [Oligoflexus sp.]
MKRMHCALFIGLSTMACGSDSKSKLDAFGTNLLPEEKTYEIMESYDIDTGLQRQFRLLSFAKGAPRILRLRMYNAIDMNGHFVNFLSYSGLRYGDTVKAKAVLVLEEKYYNSNEIEYKNSLDEDGTRTYSGFNFTQIIKDEVLIGMSGQLQPADDGNEPPHSERDLLFLCNDQYFKDPSDGTAFQKMDCDLNIEDGKLVLTYGKTAQNPAGKTFVFERAQKLGLPQ